MTFVRIEYPSECPYRDDDCRCQQDASIYCPDNFFPHECPLEFVEDEEFEDGEDEEFEDGEDDDE